MPPIVVGPRCNRRVTCDLSPSNDRSESSLAVNPLDPYNMVGASKRFTIPSIYAFSLAAYATFDGGQSWIEAPALSLPAGWAGTSDPAVAWDNAGNAYLLALPFNPGTTATDYVGPIVGIAVYKSGDGGRTWGPPSLIHASVGDDKQWAAGDGSSSSPYYGNVYAAWDDGSTLRFARTTDHGATWRGVGAASAGSQVSGVTDSFAPDLSVARDGTIYIAWRAGTSIKFVKSTDGGDSFTASAIAANGITPIPFKLPGGIFRTFTLPTGCTGSGSNVVVAWADYRDGVSRIYYRRSTNAGGSWQGSASGTALLTGAATSAADHHEFHPQLASMPAGEIGCTFYEFGPTGGGEFPPNRIHVILAVSTNNGNTFPARVTVTDTPWDPAIDAPLAHGDPNTTFIGDYFGFDASRLGFFPFWTDTRDSVQEIYFSRLALEPADLFIRDSSTDSGAVPSPGNHWEAPDLIVRRSPDGDTTFVNEPLLQDGVTDHYIYARVTNAGPNGARNVRLAVMVANWPSAITNALPATEFRYPLDWYKSNWVTLDPTKHLALDDSTPVSIPSGATKILGPVLWPASQVPPESTWHPCLLAEVRADNDDTAATGSIGCWIDADPTTCGAGAYFWGDNNICQRNLSYATVPAAMAAYIELPFLVGSVWSSTRFLEVVVDKGPELAATPMMLRMETVHPPDEPPLRPCPPGEIEFLEKCRVLIRSGDCDAGELLPAPGTVWRPLRAPSAEAPPEVTHGGEKVGREWKLNHRRASVGFPVQRGEMRRMTLSFTTPTTLEARTRPLVRVFQRNDRRTITGSVSLEITVAGAEGEA
jgi:hypothetical protein